MEYTEGKEQKKKIDEISKHLNKNDIVVFSPEYENFNLNRYTSIKNQVDFINDFSIKMIKNIETLSHYLDFIKSLIGRILGVRPKYRVNWFNENGDVIGHHNLENVRIPTIYKKLTISENDISKLKSYIDKKLNGIQYFFIPPVTNEFKLSSKQEKELNHNLLKIFKEKYPYSIENFTFENNCFYDSQYHLNYNCKERRTDIILEFLKTLNIKPELYSVH